MVAAKLNQRNLLLVAADRTRIFRTPILLGMIPLRRIWSEQTDTIDGPRVLLRVLLMVAIALTHCYSSSQTAAANANTQTAQRMRVGAGIGANVQGANAICPPAGIAAAQPAPKRTGHHKVSLSWNPGSQAAGATGSIDGYCIYRSKDAEAVHPNAACTACERVTAVAVSDTTCVDDIVEDGATYYYIVTVLKGNLMSGPSNEARASIPGDSKSYLPRPKSLPSLFCRGRPAQDIPR